MKLFLSLLLLITFPVFACSPITFREEMDDLSDYLFKNPSYSIKNCQLNEGETELQLSYFNPQQIGGFPEQRSTFYTIEYKSNFSCEFFQEATEDYKRFSFNGKMLFAESIMTATGTSCENEAYSFTLILAVDGLKNSPWKISEIKPTK